MQLLIILALLLYGGKSGAQNILEEVKPVLESIGGDDMKEALKSAEEISSVLSAVKDFSAVAQTAAAFGGTGGETSVNRTDSGFSDNPPVAFPLAPVNEIIGKDIAYSLSQYINSSLN